jgi:hypothetical protein
MAFQRRKPAAIGVKARFPGFVEPALATLIESSARRALDPRNQVLKKLVDLARVTCDVFDHGYYFSGFQKLNSTPNAR